VKCGDAYLFMDGERFGVIERGGLFAEECLAVLED
jgi:hypothetical protein